MSGEAIDDLGPYLGAAGHLFVVSENEYDWPLAKHDHAYPHLQFSDLDDLSRALCDDMSTAGALAMTPSLTCRACIGHHCACGRVAGPYRHARLTTSFPTRMHLPLSSLSTGEYPRTLTHPHPHPHPHPYPAGEYPMRMPPSRFGPRVYALVRLPRPGGWRV